MAERVLPAFFWTAYKMRFTKATVSPQKFRTDSLSAAYKNDWLGKGFSCSLYQELNRALPIYRNTQ